MQWKSWNRVNESLAGEERGYIELTVDSGTRYATHSPKILIEASKTQASIFKHEPRRTVATMIPARPLNPKKFGTTPPVLTSWGHWSRKKHDCESSLLRYVMQQY